MRPNTSNNSSDSNRHNSTEGVQTPRERSNKNLHRGSDVVYEVTAASSSSGTTQDDESGTDHTTVYPLAVEGAPPSREDQSPSSVRVYPPQSTLDASGSSCAASSSDVLKRKDRRRISMEASLTGDETSSALAEHSSSRAEPNDNLPTTTTTSSHQPALPDKGVASVTVVPVGNCGMDKDDDGDLEQRQQQQQQVEDQQQQHHDNTSLGEASLKNPLTTPPLRRTLNPNKRLLARFHDSDLTTITGMTVPPSDNGESNRNCQSEEEEGPNKNKQQQGQQQPIDINNSNTKKSKQERIMCENNAPFSTSSLDDSSSKNSDGSIVFQGSEDGSIQFEDSSLHTASEFMDKEKRRIIPVSSSFRSSFIRYSNAMRIISGKIVNHPYVQQFIVAMIILNALQMGLATFDFAYYNPTIKAAFEKADLGFLIMFTVESIFQLVFHGMNLFRDGWLTFDFLIVVCSWIFSSLQVFRTMRTLRLVARVQMLRKLCQALMEAVPRLGGILCLFILIMYIYAVMITVLFGDMYERGLLDADYFSRLDITLFTLFQMITLDWAKIVRQVMEVYIWSSIVFSTYLSFTSFILFSLIVGVVCDAVSTIEHDAQLVEKLERKEAAQERILRLQHRVDFLQKQQKSVLASVSGVLEELAKSEEGGVREVFSPDRLSSLPPVGNNNENRKAKLSIASDSLVSHSDIEEEYEEVTSSSEEDSTETPKK